jgi:hypothetical protein
MAAAAVPYLIALSVAASAYQGYSQYSAAKSQAAFAGYQNEVQNQQLKQEARNAEIQQIGEENRRLADARSLAASNRAQLAAYGQNSNMSFLGGLTQADQRSLTTSIQDIRLAGVTQQSRIADQIAVNRVSSSNAAFGARQAGWNAIGSTIGAAAQGYGMYSMYGTPAARAPAFNYMTGMEDRAGRGFA